jgi:hypothetical protein
MGVAEQLFEPDQVSAVVQILDGEAVAQGVWADSFCEPGPVPNDPHDVLDAAYGDAAGVGLSRRAGEEVIRRFFLAEVGDELATKGVAVGKYSLLSAFGFADDEGAVVAVEVVQSDPANFASAEAEPEEQPEDEAVFRVGCGSEYRL